MDVTPSDIRSHSFSRSLRGLEDSEVEAFLEEVAAQVEQLVDQRDQLEARLQWAESKLQNVKHVYDKLKGRKAQLDEREEKLDEEKQALEQRRAETDRERKEVQAEKEKLMRVIARLQGGLENELRILKDLRSGEQSVFDPDDSSSSSPVPSSSPGADDGDKQNEKSTEELINSLFPKRLGPSGPGAASGSGREASSEASEDDSEKGAAAQQFDKIKQDIQAEEATTEPVSSTGAKDEDSESEEDNVATEEVNRIMGVFEDLDS